MNQQVEHSPGGSPDTTRDGDRTGNPPLPPRVDDSIDWSYGDHPWNLTWDLLMTRPIDGASAIPEVHGLTADEIRPALRSKDILRVPVDDSALIEPVRGWPGSGFPLVLALSDEDAQVRGFAALPTQGGGAAPMACAPGYSLSQLLVACEPGVGYLGFAIDFDYLVLGLGVLETLAISLAIPVAGVVGSPVGEVDPQALDFRVKGMGVIIAYPDDAAGDAAADITRAAALDAGARSVRRLTWPAGTRSAMDVVARVGVAGLRAFLLEQGLEP